MSGVLRWEDPPPNKSGNKNKPRRTEHWREVAAELRERPGDWGVVLESDSWNSTGGIAPAITAGRLAAFRPNRHFEAQTRTTPAGYTVYARYVGGDAR